MQDPTWSPSRAGPLGDLRAKHLNVIRGPMSTLLAADAHRVCTMHMWSCDDRSAPFIEVFHRTAVQAGYDLRLMSPQLKPPAAFQKLKECYRHLSANTERFELASF